MTKNQGLFKALLIPHLLYFLLLICNTTQGLCADDNLLWGRKSECIRIPQSGKKIDFTFVIDSTGSMSDDIASVKNYASRQDLQLSLERSEKRSYIPVLILNNNIDLKK